MDDMENFFWIGIVGALVALLFAYSQARKVKQYSEGTPTMQKIAAAIRKGANAYLKRQYKTVGVIFAIIAVVLAVLAYVPWINGQGLVSKFVHFAFITGAGGRAAARAAGRSRAPRPPGPMADISAA